MNRNPHKHLTEAEFVSFVLEELPAGLEQALDQHLEQCVVCARQLEDFYTAQDEFPEQEWAKQRSTFVAALRQQIFGADDPQPWWERLLTFLESFSYRLALAEEFAVPHPPEEMESSDKLFGLFIEEKPNQDVVFRFDTTRPEFAGATIRLIAGPWQREVQMKPLPTGEVLAEVVITRAERAMLPPGTTLRATLVKGSAPPATI